MKTERRKKRARGEERRGRIRRIRRKRREAWGGRNGLPSTWSVTPESKGALPAGWRQPENTGSSPDTYSAALSHTMGSFLLQLCSPHADSHGINSSHPSFYLYHLAEAKTTLPKYPPLDKTYHPLTAAHIHLPCNCLSGLGSFEIGDLFLLPLRFIRGGLSSI